MEAIKHSMAPNYWSPGEKIEFHGLRWKFNSMKASGQNSEEMSNPRDQIEKVLQLLFVEEGRIMHLYLLHLQHELAREMANVSRPGEKWRMFSSSPHLHQLCGEQTTDSPQRAKEAKAQVCVNMGKDKESYSSCRPHLFLLDGEQTTVSPQRNGA